MTAAATSIASFNEVRRDGTLPRQKIRVLSALTDGPLTRAQIAAVTGLPVASVCRTVYDLMQDGLLCTYDTVLNPHTARPAHRVCLTAALPKNDGATSREAIAAHFNENREEIMQLSARRAQTARERHVRLELAAAQEKFNRSRWAIGVLAVLAAAAGVAALLSPLP